MNKPRKRSTITKNFKLSKIARWFKGIGTIKTVIFDNKGNPSYRWVTIEQFRKLT